MSTIDITVAYATEKTNRKSRFGKKIKFQLGEFMKINIVVGSVTVCLCFLLGCSAAYRRPENYIKIMNKNIDSLDQEMLSNLPTVDKECKKIAELLSNVQDPLQVLAQKQIPTDKSSEQVYQFWKQTKQCAQSYEKIVIFVGKGQDIPTDKVSQHVREWSWQLRQNSFKKGVLDFLDNVSRSPNPYGNTPDISAEEMKNILDEVSDQYRIHFETTYPDKVADIKDAQKYQPILDSAASTIYSHFYQLDRKLFEKRTGGKHPCEQDVCSFISSHSHFPPDESCIYPNGGWYREASGALSSNHLGTLFGSAHNEISLHYDMNKLIFVYGTKPYASGQSLEGAYYIYTGIYNYQTVMGSMNSVHSFKEIDMRKKGKDLYFYDVPKYMK